MKILFISEGYNFWKPLGLMLMSAIAKQKGHETHLALLSEGKIFETIEEVNPKVIAYGSCTGEHIQYLELNKEIKSKYKDVFTIMGGPHPTFFPEVVNEGELDAICVGEGEIAFENLLDKLELGEDLSNMNNIILPGGILNGLNPLIQDLDSLPFPDRDLFYKDIEKGSVPTMNLIVSRGCPYNCSYCFNHSFKKMYEGQRYVRKKAVDNVIKEAKEMKEKYGIKFIKFTDDMFMLGKKDKWVEEFCEKFPKEVNLPFLIYTRFEFITKENAMMLKDAGCMALDMSIESINPRIRQEILRRNMTDTQIKEGCRIARESGLSVLAYSMLGLPTSKIEDDLGVIEYYIDNKIKVPEFSIFQPYPKTDINDLCIDKKLLDKRIETNNFYDKSPLNCFTEEEKRIQKNIQLLAPIAIHYPILKALIMKWIKGDTKKWFTKVHALNKFLSYNSNIYKTKSSLKEKYNLIKKTFILEGQRTK